MNRLIPVLAMFGMAVLSGCHPVRSATPFDVAVSYVESPKNVEGVRLDDVRVEFEGFFHSFGSAGPRSGAGRYSLFEGRWPKVDTIKWRFAGDRHYMSDREATVAIPPPLELGPNERLTLWFDLDGEGVTVRLEKYDYGWIREYRRTRKSEKRKPED